MEMFGRMATWLELAVAPTWHRRKAAVRIHAVGGEAGGCFALSLDGRWVCSGRQRLTVFNGADAARHFLGILQIDHFRYGERTAHASACDGSHHCLHLHAREGLTACPIAARSVRDGTH